MTRNADGIYRWTYELNMYRNPTVLITVLKVLGLSMGLVWLFVVLISMGDRRFWWDGFLSTTKGFALVMLGFIVLGAIAYYLYALIQGGRYCVLFEMDEQGVKHTQLARQFKRAQVVAALTTLAGAAAGNPTVMGSGILAGSRASLYSGFANVKKITAVKARNVIYLDARLNHNQIYVEDEDFDEVYNFIAARCVKAKGRGRCTRTGMAQSAQ